MKDIFDTPVGTSLIVSLVWMVSLVLWAVYENWDLDASRRGESSLTARLRPLFLFLLWIQPPVAGFLIIADVSTQVTRIYQPLFVDIMSLHMSFLAVTLLGIHVQYRLRRDFRFPTTSGELMHLRVIMLWRLLFIGALHTLPVQIYAAKQGLGEPGLMGLILLVPVVMTWSMFYMLGTPSLDRIDTDMFEATPLSAELTRIGQLHGFENQKWLPEHEALCRRYSNSIHPLLANSLRKTIMLFEITRPTISVELIRGLSANAVSLTASLAYSDALTAWVSSRLDGKWRDRRVWFALLLHLLQMASLSGLVGVVLVWSFGGFRGTSGAILGCASLLVLAVLGIGPLLHRTGKLIRAYNVWRRSSNEQRTPVDFVVALFEIDSCIHYQITLEGMIRRFKRDRALQRFLRAHGTPFPEAEIRRAFAHLA